MSLRSRFSVFLGWHFNNIGTAITKHGSLDNTTLRNWLSTIYMIYLQINTVSKVINMNHNLTRNWFFIRSFIPPVIYWYTYITLFDNIYPQLKAFGTYCRECHRLSIWGIHFAKFHIVCSGFSEDILIVRVIIPFHDKKRSFHILASALNNLLHGSPPCWNDALHGDPLLPGRHLPFW